MGSLPSNPNFCILPMTHMFRKKLTRTVCWAIALCLSVNSVASAMMMGEMESQNADIYVSSMSDAKSKECAFHSKKNSIELPEDGKVGNINLQSLDHSTPSCGVCDLCNAVASDLKVIQCTPRISDHVPIANPQVFNSSLLASLFKPPRT